MSKKVLPQGVVQSTPQVEMLTRIVESIYSDMLDVTSDTGITSNARQLALGKEIERISKEGKEDLNAWVDITVPEFYLRGMERVVEKAVEAGAPVRFDDKFVRINKRAVDALIQNGYSTMNGIADKAEANTNSVLSLNSQQSILEEITKKRITGENEQKLLKRLEKIVSDQGLDRIVTKSGRSYNPKSYVQMVSRTLLTDAQWSATVNQMSMDGHDLVIVSDHFGESDLCRPWENEILSINGMYTQYTRLSTAVSAGLKHPNCRHVIDPYYEGFAKESKVWDATEQKYVPLAEAEPQVEKNIERMQAKDKLKAFESYTSKIGLNDYHGVNRALENKNIRSLDYYASKQDSPMKEQIKRLRKYL